MKKIILLITALLLPLLSVQAQGENNNWYFGNNAAVSFATSTPTAIAGSSMIQLEGVASISDVNGNLLFYTNGVNVWNKLNAVMPNGSGLLSSDSAAQAVVIVPFPGQTGKFYIFTAAAGPFWPVLPAPYNYSIVDMNLDGGNGDVIPSQKNLPLYDDTGTSTPLRANAPSYESITFTHNANANGYWLLVPLTHSVNKLYAYKVDNTGLVNVPVVSTLNFGTASAGSQAGSIKVSPSGTFLAISRSTYNTELKIYSFNNASGTISSIVGNCAACNAYSTEFSSDNKLLYFSSNTTGLNVLDVATGAGRQLFTSAFGYSALQLAIDRNIYIAKPVSNLPPASGTNFNTILYRISNPLSFATSTVTTAGQVSLGATSYAKLGLPPFVTPIASSACLDKRTLANFTQLLNATYAAATGITTLNDYTVESGVQATLEAGSFVSMQSDTYIKAGSNFHAKLQPCTVLTRGAAADGSDAKKPWEAAFKITAPQIGIYPNPSSDYVNVVSDNGMRSIAIATLEGKRVYFQDSIENQEFLVDVRNIDKGMYLLTVETDTGGRSAERLIIK